jgi:molecular chaperone DnaK (HSP70)
VSPEYRYIVGIDLGTTNSSVSYVDMASCEAERPWIQKFPVHQLTGPGEFGPLPVLPSFLYIPGEYDINEQDMAAPWSVSQRSRDDRNFVGAFARDHGGKVPARLVSSAKSWMCSHQVDTRARILPWGAGDDVFKVSPVHASAAYLKHIRKAWNVAMGDDDELYLEHQMVIVTIPASFDEVARDMTLQACAMAHLDHVILLEEPLAAFYSWLIDHEEDWSDHVGPDQLILVCDVGGGTTDFTLIQLRDVDGSPRFERIAVGHHLILGGDNMDFSIARKVAGGLGKSPSSMSRDTWKTLCHQCRQVKEKILDGKADADRITIVGAGSGLIAGTMTAQIDRPTIESVVLDQFFPMSGAAAATDASVETNSWGLPYEADTAITGHLTRFLDGHKNDIHAFTGRERSCPDLILFNGGALKSALVQKRIRHAIDAHFSGQGKMVPRRLVNAEMDLAVSLGAAYYGLVKSGIGVRVGSGSPRSYYIGVGDGRQAGPDGRVQAVCLVERGLDEGSAITLSEQSFNVLANRPVTIDLFSSSFRSGDRCGDLVGIDDTFSVLPPLNTVIQFGSKGSQSEIPVHLEAGYTEAGTLEIWCQSRHTPHRWRLRFQLRGEDAADTVADSEVFEASRVDAARSVVREAFSGKGDKSALSRLASAIAGTVSRHRRDWPLSFLRDMTDTLLECMPARRISADYEARWMNLAGYCLRPGMGEGFDPHRIKQLWKIYKQGPVHANAPQVRLEWWIMWRRVSAGLSAGQQRQFFQDTTPALTAKKSRIRQQEFLEMWMAAANLERLNPKDKVVLGRQLVDHLVTRKAHLQLIWSLSRIGARDLLYASIDRVIPPADITSWIGDLLTVKWKNPKPVVNMLSHLCRCTGDPLRDVDAQIRDRVTDWIASAGRYPDALARLDRPSGRSQKETDAVFGEALPAGLILTSG